MTLAPEEEWDESEGRAYEKLFKEWNIRFMERQQELDKEAEKNYA